MMIKKINIVAGALLLIILSSGGASSGNRELSGDWGIYDSKPESVFKPLDDKRYKAHFEDAAKYFIAIYNMNNEVNDFCLIGYKWSDKNRENNVNVIWKNHYLINWEMPYRPAGNADYVRSLILSKPAINLKDDVVPYSEIGFRTALWPEEGIKQITDDCLKNGNQVQIQPFQPDPKWNIENKPE
ncbi:hypothetical protein [Morganella morganii]|uniref:hypothetical protein n=1 Tax=Morganella morganii TaxID=582 RepID=UPI002367F1DF|nr:hypothetical protein [Morganella morganii]